MKLVVISYPEKVADEGKIINELFKEGLTCFHLRKPHDTVDEISGMLDEIEPQYYPFIALHQHHAISDQFGIRRIHYPEEMRNKSNTEDMKLLREQGYVLSTSIHQNEMVHTLPLFDYVFFGPVFNSISKKDHEGIITDEFTLDKPASKPLLVALGGVEPANIGKLKTLNFDGVAVLGTIWQNPDAAIGNFIQLQTICSSYA